MLISNFLKYMQKLKCIMTDYCDEEAIYDNIDEV